MRFELVKVSRKLCKKKKDEKACKINKACLMKLTMIKISKLKNILSILPSCLN